jgi:tRNA(Ser,Leu) C12 N-acetylase TAN1
MIPTDFNLIVTARTGEQRTLRRALARLARLRFSGYRNVFVARVDDPDVFLAHLAELRERWAGLDRCLGRVVPLDRCFAVDAARFEEQLAAEALALIDRIAGQSFHVRLERRGHKGRIETMACERDLGARLVERAAELGTPATVTFADPEVILAVEVVGPAAGLGVMGRERRRYPFVRVA